MSLAKWSDIMEICNIQSTTISINKRIKNRGIPFNHLPKRKMEVVEIIEKWPDNFDEQIQHHHLLLPTSL
jgi:hypothetical protein